MNKHLRGTKGTLLLVGDLSGRRDLSPPGWGPIVGAEVPIRCFVCGRLVEMVPAPQATRCLCWELQFTYILLPRYRSVGHRISYSLFHATTANSSFTNTSTEKFFCHSPPKPSPDGPVHIVVQIHSFSISSLRRVCTESLKARLWSYSGHAPSRNNHGYRSRNCRYPPL